MQNQEQGQQDQLLVEHPKGYLQSQEIEEFDFEIDIPTKDEPNMLIDYADNTVNHYLLYKKIEQEPQYYLNFGFDLKDYSSFLLKQTFMRAERKVIEERIRKFRGDDLQPSEEQQ